MEGVQTTIEGSRRTLLDPVVLGARRCHDVVGGIVSSGEICSAVPRRQVGGIASSGEIVDESQAVFLLAMDVRQRHGNGGAVSSREACLNR